MGKRQHVSPQPINGPVHIRRNVEDYGDPYISEEQLHDGSICKVCGDVYSSGRWNNPDQLGKKYNKPESNQIRYVTCPGCRKVSQHAPSGVLILSGRFVEEHREEILNLIRNETMRADAVNPLARVMSISSGDGEMQITTTNEKLAQRIGKALHKAYSGEIQYSWPGDDKLARVKWHREI